MGKEKKRGPQPKPRVHVDRKRFHEALTYGHTNIKELGEKYTVGMTENAIHKQLEHPDGMHEDLLNKIAKLVNVDPEYIKGTYNIRSDTFDEETIRILESWIRPDRYPYVRKESAEISYEDYYRPMLLIHEIPFEDFLSLHPSERIQFQHEIEGALLGVFYKHFKERYQDQFERLDMIGINSLEDNYNDFGLDYWKDPNYYENINAIWNEIEASYVEPNPDEMVEELIINNATGETKRHMVRYEDVGLDLMRKYGIEPKEDHSSE